MLRRQLILGISSGLLVSQGVRAKTVSDLVVPKERKLQLNAKPYYQLIEIKGTAFERGKRYGSSASGAIKRNIDFYSSAFEKSANIDWPQAQKLAMKFLPVIEKYCPSYVEEMKGIAEGAGRSFEDILTLNCRSEVLFAKADACSCIIIPEGRGKNGHVFMGQTWDWMASARQNSVVLMVHQEGEPSILMICEAGMVGGKGLNSEGISICLNATSVGKGKIGVPLHLMMRKVLDSSLATEAIKAVSMLPRAGSGAFNIATRSGFEMVIEFSPDQFDVIYTLQHHGKMVKETRRKDRREGDFQTSKQSRQLSGVDLLSRRSSNQRRTLLFCLCHGDGRDGRKTLGHGRISLRRKGF